MRRGDNYHPGRGRCHVANISSWPQAVNKQKSINGQLMICVHHPILFHYYTCTTVVGLCNTFINVCNYELHSDPANPAFYKLVI